jgi:hypothetical protein
MAATVKVSGSVVDCPLWIAPIWQVSVTAAAEQPDGVATVSQSGRVTVTSEADEACGPSFRIVSVVW